jgi:hypothetical protein
MPQTLAPLVAMYRNSIPGQLTFENFYLPFGGYTATSNLTIMTIKKFWCMTMRSRILDFEVSDV